MARNADSAAASEAKPKKALPKDKQLALIRSLKSEKDDERTTISKKISWILRHGAKQAGVPQGEGNWVLVEDLLKATILEGITNEVLMQVIVDSNGKKLRYELKETANGTLMRAYAKEERKAKEREDGSSMQLDKKESKKDLDQNAPPFVPSGTVTAAAPAAAAAAAAPAVPYPTTPTAPPMGYYNPWGFFPPMMNPYMPFGWPMVPPNKFSGRIKSYNPEKGYGFIECPQTHATYQRDVFLHKAHIGDLTEGTYVSFTCEVNKQGMPQAKDVAALYPGMAVPAPAPTGKGGKGKGKDSGKGKGGKGDAKGGKDGKGKGKGGRKGKEGKEGKNKEEKKDEEGESTAKEKTEGGEASAEPAAAAPAAEAPAAAAEGAAA